MKIHKEMYYFDVMKDSPTEADGDWVGNVLVFDATQGWFACHWSKVSSLRGYSGYAHWMQMPKAPDVNDREF